MKKLIIANWKMSPASIKEAKTLLAGYRRLIKNPRAEIVAAPPLNYLFLFERSSRFKLGSQDIFWENEGAHTGEISPKMLQSSGVKYAVVGHSEKRALGENDAIINKKIRAGLEAGLKIILAVGEKSRENPDFWKTIKHQLLAGLKGIKKKFAKNIIVAYEPVWAIGSGKTDSPEKLFEITILIRKVLAEIFGRNKALKTPILYGGSVEPENAASFLRVDGINGLLVGSASLNAKKFSAIAKAAR